MANADNDEYKLRGEPKKQFNKIRRILLRNIPPSTEGEIEEFLEQFKAEKIEISESLDTAIVTLKNGRQLEEAVSQLDNNKLKDNDVTVTFCASDKLICVAHLPPRYTDEEMHKMMEEYGKLKTCFIMRSETSGRSKSYALLEFEEQDMEKVRKIRDELDWKEVGSDLLHADFIEPTYQTWERLQSRCLAVSGLPKDFTETNKLREMFSVVTSPVYCQIVMLEKESLGMGIVEFRKPEEAEETWEKVQEEKIEDKEITVTFCIPSKSAVFINNRIMWKFSDKLQKSSLLPDPVSAKPVISNNAIVQSLVKQNPTLIDDFTKVLAEFHQAYVNHMMSPGNKPGLLGPAPTLPMSPMMNPHLQMGLLIMLVLHIHAEKKEQFTGLLAKQLNSLAESPSSTESPPATQSAESGKKPSILGDPMTAQANIVLTNLKKQLNQVSVTEEDERNVTSSSPAVRSVLAKFMQNARFLNLNLLVNLGQMVMNMHANLQGGPMPPPGTPAVSVLGGRPAGGALLNPPGSGKGLLGDVPRPKNNPATMRFMKTLEAVASQKIGGQNRGLLSAIMTNINASPTIGKLEKKTSLLGEPPQHLRQKDGGMGGPGGRNMGGQGNMGGGMGGMGMGGMDIGSGMGGMDSMGGGIGNMGGGMGNMGGGMGNMGGGMGNMGGGMGNMGGGMGNMGGGMGNMGGGMGNMGGGMGNMGGGMGNMGGGMGNMGGGMANMGGGMGNMGGGMGNMGGAGMGGSSMAEGMGGNLGGGMGDMSGMGQQGGNKQSWGSAAGQGNMGRGAGANPSTGNKADSYSTFGSYSGGYGDMTGAYGSGYTEEYSQFNQGDYNSGGYGDSSMYGGDQSGYQYSDYSGNYNTGQGQDTYNFQGSNNYSGNFGDYTGGYSSPTTGTAGFNQSGNVQDGNRFGGGGAGSNWGGQGGTNASNTSGGLGNGMRNNVGMSKNFSGGGTGAGGGSGMGQGAGDAFGSGVGTASAGRQGLLGAGKTSGTTSGTSSNMGGNYGNQGSGVTGMGRTNTSAESYQASSNQGYMAGGNSMGTNATNMGSYSGYGTSEMEGYSTGSYNDGSGTGAYGSYSMGDYSTYNQAGYTNTDSTASYSTAGSNTTGIINTSNPLTPAGSKRGYGDYSGQQQQSLGGQYDKRPRLY
ncbi:hypothetical protein ACOMHN_017718 [Nucella lapillus]